MKFYLKKIKKMQTALRDIGYYFSEIKIDLIDLNDNKVDLVFNINLGDKAKIKNNLLGNKIYKDKKLKSLIISEEYKFWKLFQEKNI